MKCPMCGNEHFKPQKYMFVPKNPDEKPYASSQSDCNYVRLDDDMGSYTKFLKAFVCKECQWVALFEK